MMLSDDELLRRIARGHQPSMGTLYDRYAKRLFAFALKILKDRSDAEDSVHELFLEVWRRAGDYDPRRGSVLSWITVRLRCRCVDVQRRSRLHARKTAQLPVRASATPRMVAELDSRRAAAALAEIAEGQREVVRLAFFDGLTNGEVAERLGVPTGTVKSRRRAGLIALRGVLEPAPAPC